MTLFTKTLCSACQDVKQEFNLNMLGVKIEELSPDNPGALAHLAWHELVEDVELKGLPILVLDDSSSITEVNKIREYLSSISL
ncbi:MAG: hypothetical protein V1753_01570 [Pseudomonadota bacterium]